MWESARPLVPVLPMRALDPAATVEAEVDAMITTPNQGKGPPKTMRRDRTLPKAAALSFTLGLVALRICWLPGVNCAVALAAVALGLVGLLQVLRGHGMLGGLDEAITGIVLGIVVLGLSMFFVSAFIAAYR